MAAGRGQLTRTGRRRAPHVPGWRSNRPAISLPHARQRCDERKISAPDIEVALEGGRYVPRRDRYDERHGDWSYCFEGASGDGERLRVVVAFEDWMLVVTVVALDLEGPEG